MNKRVNLTPVSLDDVPGGRGCGRNRVSRWSGVIEEFLRMYAEAAVLDPFCDNHAAMVARKTIGALVRRRKYPVRVAVRGNLVYLIKKNDNKEANNA